MTNDHFSILNFQFTSKDRWPSPLMQPQQNLTCLQRLLVFKDSRNPYTGTDPTGAAASGLFVSSGFLLFRSCARRHKRKEQKETKETKDL